SPSDRSIGLSVAEGNCVVERRGGEQPEANDQSINKTMMNSIRPEALASLLSKDEAKNGIRPGKGERKIRDLSLESTVSRKIGMHGVVGDRMVGSWSDMNQGSRAGKERRSWLLAEPEEPWPEGDRASVVARKRGNARGAKGGRKVEAGRTEGRTTNPRQCRQGLNKREKSEPAGPGWNRRSGPNACWQPWKRGSKEADG